MRQNALTGPVNKRQRRAKLMGDVGEETQLRFVDFFFLLLIDFLDGA